MDVLKILSMWKDIEGSYLQMSKKRNLSRADFLKLLVSYKDATKTHGINSLLVRLQKGMAELEDAEAQHDCLVLSQALVDLGNYIDVNGIPNDIPNLALFLMEVLGNEDKYSVDFLDTFYLMNKDGGLATTSSEKIPYSHMIRRFGCVESACFIESCLSKSKSTAPKTYVGYELLSDKFKVLDIYEYQQHAREKFSNNDFKDNFDKECWISIPFLYSNLSLEKVYLTDKSNLISGTLFDQKIIKQEPIVCQLNGYSKEFIKCSLQDFEVFVIC